MSERSESGSVLGDLPLRNGIRLIGLVALVAAVAPESQVGFHGAHLAHFLLLAVVVGSWVSWMVARDKDLGPSWLTGVSLVLLGGAGGALAPSAPAAIGFAAFVGVGASFAFDVPLALVITAVSPAVHLISAELNGHTLDPVFGSIAAGLAGLMIGVSRRQTLAAARQAALMAGERDRTALEHERAELLAERNQLAREIHDVLAHTLGAVAVQIEALDSTAATDDRVTLHRGLQKTRGLVTQGLQEVRRAVSVLRDDAAPLPEQLKELCELAGTTLGITGDTRPLTPHVSLALYRIAQESLTNAAKHAPGATGTVELAFIPGAIRLTVTNGPSTDGPSGLATDGGGYGLQGMRERVLLLGGELEAGPTAHGWLVRAKLPA